MMVREKQSDDSTVIGLSAESGIGKARARLRLTLERFRSIFPSSEIRTYSAFVLSRVL